MAIGGAFAVTDRRYALAKRKVTQPAGKTKAVQVATTAASSAVE
jgi:hypothetical protein